MHIHAKLWFVFYLIKIFYKIWNWQQVDLKPIENNMTLMFYFLLFDIFLYRAALDAIKKLDEILKQKKAYRDVFLQDAVGLRNK